MIAYTALFSALLGRPIALACGSTWLSRFIAFFVLFFVFNIHRSGVLTALAWLVLHETAAVSAQVLCTPYNPAPCHFKATYVKVYACLAVTCHLHFWQNDRDLLRATAVTRGWNGYRNKSQHRKSILEKEILPPLLQGFEPTTFQSRVLRSNHWAIPAPWTKLLPQSHEYPNLMALIESVDSCAEIKECPFCGVTSSCRVWRKVPESDARSVGWHATAASKPRNSKASLEVFFSFGVAPAACAWSESHALAAAQPQHALSRNRSLSISCSLKRCCCRQHRVWVGLPTVTMAACYSERARD